MSTEIPIIESLVRWMREQDSSLKIDHFQLNHFNIKSGKTKLGQVTLIFPGQDLKQAIQYDWYREIWPLLETDPNSRYYRMIYGIADPNSFSEVLKTAQSLRDGKEVKWHQIFIPTPHGLKLIEGAHA